MGNVVAKTVNVVGDVGNVVFVKPVEFAVVNPVKKLIGNNDDHEAKGEPLNLDILYPNMWVDCLDTRTEQWLEAQVVEVNRQFTKGEEGKECIDMLKSFIRVHFKGWNRKWDKDRIYAAEIFERVHTLHSHTKRPKRDDDFPAFENEPHVGARVNIEDSTGTWAEATIIDVVNNPDLGRQMFKVTYTCWGPRWDEWLNFDTYRLAEHQSMSAKKDEPTPNALNIKFYKQISEQGQMVVVSRDEHKNPFHADAFSRSLFRAACDQLYANTMYVDTVQQAVYSYIWHHWPLFQASLNTLNAEETKKYAVDRSWEQLKKLEGKDDFLLQNLLPGEAELQALADVYQMPVFVFSVHQSEHPHVYLYRKLIETEVEVESKEENDKGKDIKDKKAAAAAQPPVAAGAPAAVNIKKKGETKIVRSRRMVDTDYIVGKAGIRLTYHLIGEYNSLRPLPGPDGPEFAGLLQGKTAGRHENDQVGTWQQEHEQFKAAHRDSESSSPSSSSTAAAAAAAAGSGQMAAISSQRAGNSKQKQPTGGAAGVGGGRDDLDEKYSD